MAEKKSTILEALSSASVEQIDQFVKAPQVQSIVQKEVTHQLEQKLKEIKPELVQQLENGAREKVDKASEGLREKLEKDRINVIQATSIITVFIAFLTVQFSILSKVNNVGQAAGLIMILLASIITFVLLIDVTIRLSLPFERSKSVKGLNMNPFASIFGYTEKVPLSIDPKTWGIGLIYRIAVLGVGVLLFIIGGTLIAING